MNENCVIGILCIDIAFKIQKKFGEKWKSFIPKSYVKFLGNCKIIPIRIGKPKEYYYDILRKLNGVLMPGGAVWFNDPENGKCVETAKIIFYYAKELNSNGIYFPLWGTCLGYQMLLFADASENADIIEPEKFRTKCEPFQGDLPINFENDYKESKLFHDLSDDLLTIMKTEQITFYNHQFCITKDTMKECNISDNWKVLATRHVQDLEFITSIEHTKYPFYGVQFHPEKHGDESNSNENQIECNKYFSNFFINEVKKSYNSQENNRNDNLNEYLINNYELIQTGFEQWNECYVFEESIQ